MNIYEHLNIYDAITTVINHTTDFDINELMSALQRQHINIDINKKDMYDHIKVCISSLELGYCGYKRNNSQECRPDFAGGDLSEETANINAETFWIYKYYDKNIKIRCCLYNTYKYVCHGHCGGVAWCNIEEHSEDIYYDNDIMEKECGTRDLPDDIENIILNITNMFALSKHHENVVLNCESDQLFDFVRCEMIANEYIENNTDDKMIIQNKTNNYYDNQ